MADGDLVTKRQESKRKEGKGMPNGLKQQERCAIAKMTAWCAGNSKQTATPPPKITWLSVDSIQPDVVDVGVERTFSPQNFSMFSWEKGDDLWATKSKVVGQLVFKIFNLCGHDPPTSQTGRQTDRQMTCDCKTALCTIVHRAVKRHRIRRIIKLLTQLPFIGNAYVHKYRPTEINVKPTWEYTFKKIITYSICSDRHSLIIVLKHLN